MSNLPRSAIGFDLPASLYRAALDVAMPIAARVGYSFTEQDLSAVADAARVDVDHPLVANPVVLYHEALRYAHSCLWPMWSDRDSARLHTMIPGDAIREFCVQTFQRFRNNPNAVRLIVAENMFRYADVSSTVGLLEDSPVVLVVDRLLMRGHDVGAFRTGISAEDFFIMVTALCAFPVTQGPAFHALYGMDVTDRRNTAGMELLIADAAVAFLSATMVTDQGSSYTHSSDSPSMGSSVGASLYSNEDVYPDQDFLEN